MVRTQGESDIAAALYGSNVELKDEYSTIMWGKLIEIK